MHNAIPAPPACNRRKASRPLPAHPAALAWGRWSQEGQGDGDISQLRELARQGRWDETPFLADLGRRRFALVVTAFDVFSGDATNVYTTGMLRALRANYRPDRIERGVTWNYHLYRPISPGAATPPGTADTREDHQETE